MDIDHQESLEAEVARLREELDDVGKAALREANRCTDFRKRWEARERDWVLEHDRAEAAEARCAQLEQALQRAVYLAQHLWQMVPQEVWREHGAEWMGQYEGDYHAEKVAEELKTLAEGGN